MWITLGGTFLLLSRFIFQFCREHYGYAAYCLVIQHAPWLRIWVILAQNLAVNQVNSMPSAPTLTNAGQLTSADFLAHRVKASYASLNEKPHIGEDELREIESLYSPDVCFEDPAHGIQGRRELMAYFEKLFTGVEKCQFRFQQTLSSDTDVFLSWTMSFSHPRLNNGDLIRVEGASYLRTRNGLIFYHRDYFDLGAMLYENLPLLGTLIQRIRTRLSK